MSWPFENRLAYYDAWLAAAAIAAVGIAATALELTAMGQARAASRRIATAMATAEPTAGEHALPVEAVERDARDRLRRAGKRLRGIARRLARPAAAGVEPDDAAAPIRRRIRVDALRAALGDGALSVGDTAADLHLAELVVQRLSRAPLRPDRIRALRVATTPPVPLVDPVATGSVRTIVVLELVIAPTLLGPALALLREPNPQLLLERLSIGGTDSAELRVQLELAQIEVTLGGEPGLPRSHRDPEDGWIVDDLPTGGRW